MPRLLASQLLAGAQQRTQFLHVFFRHEARLNQPAGQKVGNPHRIVQVGLAARNVLDVRRIGDDQGEVSFAQNLPHRQTPVASIATWLQRHSSNHANKARKPSVVVSNVRHSRVTLRPAPSRTQATIVALWTSRPATRSCITSIVHSSSSCAASVGSLNKKKPRKRAQGHCCPWRQ